MNVELIRGLVAAHGGGGPPAVEPRSRFEALEPALEDDELRDYLLHCLPREAILVSGVWLLDRAHVLENALDLAPGAKLRPYDYVPIASSVGGNLIVAHAWGDRRAKVYWADHTGWYDDTISYQDRAAGAWVDLAGYTPEHVERALVPLAPDLEGFLVALLGGLLTERLDALD